MIMIIKTVEVNSKRVQITSNSKRVYITSNSYQKGWYHYYHTFIKIFFHPIHVVSFIIIIIIVISISISNSIIIIIISIVISIGIIISITYNCFRGRCFIIIDTVSINDTVFYYCFTKDLSHASNNDNDNDNNNDNDDNDDDNNNNDDDNGDDDYDDDSNDTFLIYQQRGSFHH